MTCKSYVIGVRTNEPTCYINEFPLTDSIHENAHFSVAYAKPSEIERVEFVNLVPVKYVPKQMFTTFPNLHTLDMSDTRLEELRPDDFIDAMNLRTIDLHFNRLELIKSNVFSSRQPNEIQKGTVYPLHKLSKLMLLGNHISEIEADAFNGLTDLVDLNLDFNQLSVIRQRIFVGLPSLLYLDLGHNKIEIIEDGAFDLPELMNLYLGFNKLKTLSDVVFDRTPKLIILQLNRNALEDINRSLYRLSSATRISLELNRIEDIDLAAFAKMPSLKELNLEASGIKFARTQIEDGTFEHWNSSLETLNIISNNLSDATELNKLRIFPNLRYLHLGHNAYGGLDVGNNRTLRDILPRLEVVVFCEWSTTVDQRRMRYALETANITYTDECSIHQMKH